jgi:hypothetical protein
MALALRTLRVTYADAARTLQRDAPDQVPKVQRRALHMLDDVAVGVRPVADPDLVREIEETRRMILGGAAQ